MIYYNGHSNLLEDVIYHYELQDVQEPELFRDLFDYKSIPKTAFNHRHVPMCVPDEMRVYVKTFFLPRHTGFPMCFCCTIRQGERSIFCLLRMRPPPRENGSPIPAATRKTIR